MNDTLELQRQSTIAEDAKVLELLTARLEARSQAHLHSLGETHSLVKSSLEESFTAQQSAQILRAKRLHSLQESNCDTQITLGIRSKDVEEIADSHRQVRLSFNISFQAQNADIRLSLGPHVFFI